MFIFWWCRWVLGLTYLLKTIYSLIDKILFALNILNIDFLDKHRDNMKFSNLPFNINFNNDFMLDYLYINEEERNHGEILIKIYAKTSLSIVTYLFLYLLFPSLHKNPSFNTFKTQIFYCKINYFFRFQGNKENEEFMRIEKKIFIQE